MNADILVETAANMIPAQRDFFGAHAKDRIDRSGPKHIDWSAP